ncbi:MAG: hypothetical protein L0312_13755, partial [Acidobacteria bacterium]|nr:hypothetical protein [Acidobacteriota bacterium]
KIVPILPILELSGANAEMFMMGPGLWTWEDLRSSSSLGITAYKSTGYNPPSSAGFIRCIVLFADDGLLTSMG